MTPSQPVFLVVTAVVASPLLLLLERGWIDVAGALERLVLIAVVCWVALRVVVSLAFPSPEELRRNAARAAAADPTSTTPQVAPDAG